MYGERRRDCQFSTHPSIKNSIEKAAEVAGHRLSVREEPSRSKDKGPHIRSMDNATVIYANLTLLQLFANPSAHTGWEKRCIQQSVRPVTRVIVDRCGKRLK